VDIKGILFSIVSNAGQRWRHAWHVSSALFELLHETWYKGKELGIFHPLAQNVGLPTYQLSQILSKSGERFWFCVGSNFWHFNKKEKSPL